MRGTASRATVQPEPGSDIGLREPIWLPQSTAARSEASIAVPLPRDLPTHRMHVRPSSVSTSGFRPEQAHLGGEPSLKVRRFYRGRTRARSHGAEATGSRGAGEKRQTIQQPSVVRDGDV